MADTERYDIVIAGAGLTGAAFALAAAQAGLRVVMVDPQPFSAQLVPSFDGRSTAIAFSTFRMLDALELGETLRPHACRMDHILVTDGRRPGAASRPASPAFLRFDAEEIGGRTGGEPLGYMVENRRIRTALAEAVTQAGIEVRAPASVAGVEVDPGKATVTLADGSRLIAPLVVGAAEFVGIVGLLGACVLMSVFGEPVLAFADHTATWLADPSGYISAVLPGGAR